MDRTTNDTFRILAGTKLIPENINANVDKDTLALIQKLGEILEQFGKDLKETGLLGPGVNNLANEMASSLNKITGAVEKFCGALVTLCKIAWENIVIAAGAGSSAAQAHASKIFEFVKTSSSKARMFASTPMGMALAATVAIVGVVGLGYYGYTKYQKKQIEKKINLEIEESIKKLKEKIYSLQSNPKEFKKYFTSGQFVTEVFSISNITSDKIKECHQDVINYLQEMMRFGFDLGFDLGFENS
ncbi:MAG: hypothetical protein ACRCU2_27555 [Planktothrix sp.]